MIDMCQKVAEEVGLYFPRTLYVLAVYLGFTSFSQVRYCCITLCRQKKKAIS